MRNLRVPLDNMFPAESKGTFVVFFALQLYKYGGYDCLSLLSVNVAFYIMHLIS